MEPRPSLSPTGKLLQPFDSGSLWSVGQRGKGFCKDLRKHQTGKETGGERMLKVLGLQRLKQGKVKIGFALLLTWTCCLTHVNPYSQPSANLVHGQAPNFLFQTQMGNPLAEDTFTYQGGYIPQAFTNNSIPSYNGPMHPTVTPTSSYPFYTQPMYAPPNMHAYPNLAGPFVDSAGFVTPFVRWIEDYPLSDGLKMPSHIGSYDGKGDLNNLLHLFEGAVRMQKWLIYTDDTLQILGLHEEQRISGFVHSLRTRSLVEHLSTDLPSAYKGLMEKTYTWVEAREVATNGVSNDQRDGYERSKKSSWDNNKGQKNRDRFSPYQGPSHGLLPSLSKSPKEILAMEKAARSFEPPPNMFGSKRS
ncbi:hypothetical protein Tco_0415052 [Tanacetum coccineum]